MQVSSLSNNVEEKEFAILGDGKGKISAGPWEKGV